MRGHTVLILTPREAEILLRLGLTRDPEPAPHYPGDPFAGGPVIQAHPTPDPRSTDLHARDAAQVLSLRNSQKLPR